MNTKIRIWFSAFLLVLLAGMSSTVFAAETSSSIRGNIYDESGSPLVAAQIVVQDMRTGVERSYATNASGAFLATNLPVGGPYKVTVNEVKSVLVESITLGEIYNLSVNLQSDVMLEEVIVVGQAAQIIDTAAGPTAAFTSFELETAVAFSRDITDVYGVDPRLNIDFDGRTAVTNCGGKHPRFNSVTLDGVSHSDRFGLNQNGYSTATGMPFPYDAIQQVTVELAPFDVTYGGFSACNINAVTKSGTNEWDGNAFYEYTTEDLRGDTLGRLPDQKFSSDNYKQEKMGFSVGGPIIKDRLFFFVAYEESQQPRFLAQGPAGSGNGQEKSFLSQADYDRIKNIATSVWGYDPGGMPGNGAQEDEKYMLRLDWNINDDHNVSLIYNYYDGFESRGSDSYSDTFEFDNHFYTKGSESETYTLMFSSQWTDAFSTELFYSTNEMIDMQVTVGPKDFGDFQIRMPGYTTVYLGADDSRQANQLGTESDFLKLTAQYLAGNHVITGGYEREDLSVFNIFVQHSRGGEWDFNGINRPGSDAADCASLTAQGRYDRSNCDVSGIDQFELGRPSTVYYGSGGGSNDPLDAAASFTNTGNTVYIQDEMFFAEYDLTVVAGLRYDWFTSNDRPNYNQVFSDANGMRNDESIDGLDLLMPRIGFTWEAREDLSVRGGLGLYSGGNPNVWISNAWSNDGVTNVQPYIYYSNRGYPSVFGPGAIDLTGSNPGYDVPQELYDIVAATSGPETGQNRSIVLIDPNYKQPSEWKLALGATWDMPWFDIVADFDYLHTEQVDPAMYLDVSQELTGYTSAGTPMYDSTNGSQNYMLTNSSRSGKADMFSMVFKKDFDSGLDMSFGYAYTDATDVSPMTSYVAASNFNNLATNDIGDPVPATSNYVTPHRFTLRASYGHNFFSDLETRVTLYGWSAQGQPGSYTMEIAGLEDYAANARHLLYVPQGSSDPNVVFDDDFDTSAFFAFIEEKGLKPGFQARNAHHAKWSTRFDFRIDQELPTFINGTRARLYMKMYNLGNFIKDSWGEVWDAQFYSERVVEDGYVNAAGQFVYVTFSDADINDFRQENSLWEVRIGLEFNF